MSQSIELRCVLQAVLTLAFASLALAAQSYIVVDNQTGMILAAERPNEKLQVASLTKIATAMVVLDWAQLNKTDLSQMAPISPRAVRAGGINPVGLQEGDSLSLRDLLYTALMASDNVAATALAEFVGAKLPECPRPRATQQFRLSDECPGPHPRHEAYPLSKSFRIRQRRGHPALLDGLRHGASHPVRLQRGRLSVLRIAEDPHDSRLSRRRGHARRTQEYQ